MPPPLSSPQRSRRSSRSSVEPTAAAPSRRRRAGSSARPLSSSSPVRPGGGLLPLLLLAGGLASGPMAAVGQQTGYPQVDLAKLGSVALAGSFAGLSFYDPSSSAAASTANTTLSGSRSTLFAATAGSGASAAPIPIAQTSDGGSISAVCHLPSSAGSSTSSNGTLFVGGSFSSLSGVDVRNVGLVDLSSGAVSALGSGVDGAVNALYCNSSSGEVWLGGAFSASSSGGGNGSASTGRGVLVWSTADQSFAPPAFGGFPSGEVESIEPSDANSSLIFAGSFGTSGLAGGLTNGTAPGAAGTGSLPVPQTTIYSPGSTPFTASLTPLVLGPGASISASPSSSLAGFSNAEVLLCPRGGSDPSTWLAGDGQNALITVDLGQGAVVATGLRIGNTFVADRGTTAFSAVTIPNNEPLELAFVDPVTGANETCTNPCPLATNASVPFQDFLFAGGLRSLSGFQLTLLEWTGDGPGLHILEVLSAGSYAPLPVNQDNTTACASLPQTGSTILNGTWSQLSVPSALGGISSAALRANVPVASFSAGTVPSARFYPYVTGTGNYSVGLVIPGCLAVDDCDSRSSLDVQFVPYLGSGIYRQTIAPVRYERRFELYSGAVQATSTAFSPIVTVSMSTTPVGINGDSFSVVVGRVELELLTVDTTGTGAGVFPTGDAGGTGGGFSNGTVSGPTAGAEAGVNGGRLTGFGLFEWSAANATVAMAGSTNGTEVVRLAQALATAIKSGSAASSSPTIVGAVKVDNRWFLAGSFSTTSTGANVVVSSESAGNGSIPLSAMPGNGLNGPVRAMLASGTSVFLGGSFTATSDGLTPLAGLARFDSASSSWASLGGGVTGGDVSSLALSVDGRTLLVGGSFDRVLALSASTAGQSGGLAAYDLATSSWLTADSAAVFGQVALVKATASGRTLFAGAITAVAGEAASSLALLSSGSGGQPQIEGLPLDFDMPTSSLTASGAMSSPTASSSSVSRRAAPHGSNHSPAASLNGRQWLPSTLVSPAVGFVKRAFSPALSSSPARRQQATSPSSIPATLADGSAEAPAVLAAGFWTNSSASDARILILGGNFTAGQAANLLMFDRKTQQARPLPGAAVDGTVRAVEVVSDTAFVGGDFDGGFRAYDLKAQAWKSGISSLDPASGAAAVSTILTRPSTSDVIVAGTFASAGSVACASVCSWSTSSNSWSALGSGLAGTAEGVAFGGGNKADLLFVAGALTVDGRSTAVARYTYGNSSWVAVEGGETLPGPATAIVVDDHDASAIFVAGAVADGGATYLYRWNGNAWSAVSDPDTLNLGSSTVSQLAFVPLSAKHDGGDANVIPSNRALLATGSLALAGTGAGTYSAALFDGAQWFPYVRATQQDGSAGAVRGLFNSERSFSFDIRNFLARGIVVVICMAIALGIVFLAVLIGLLIALWRRNRQTDDTQSPYSAYGKPEDSTYGAGYSEDDLHSPTSPHRAQMLDNINAATEGVITGAAVGGGAAVLAGGGAKSSRGGHSRGPSSDEGYPTEEVAGVAGVGAGAAGGQSSEGSGEEVEARVAHARWSLTPEPGAERELRIKAGQPYLILNDADPEWWLALDPSTGEQGAVPASWML